MRITNFVDTTSDLVSKEQRHMLTISPFNYEFISPKIFIFYTSYKYVLVLKKKKKKLAIASKHVFIK